MVLHYITRERTDLGTDTGLLPVWLARIGHQSSREPVTGPAVICPVVCFSSTQWQQVSGCSTQHVSCAWIKFEWLKWTEVNRPPKSREWLDLPRSMQCGCSCAADIVLQCLPTCPAPTDKTGDGERGGGRHARRQCSCSSRQISSQSSLRLIT